MTRRSLAGNVEHSRHRDMLLPLPSSSPSFSRLAFYAFYLSTWNTTLTCLYAWILLFRLRSLAQISHLLIYSLSTSLESSEHPRLSILLLLCGVKFCVCLLRKACSSLYSWSLAQCLAYSSCSINICSLNGISVLGREGQLVRMMSQGWLLYLSHLLPSPHIPAQTLIPSGTRKGNINNVWKGEAFFSVLSTKAGLWGYAVGEVQPSPILWFNV